ncbi:Asp23/Gls24 family envelope stress response protein [Aldersonia sp. NBC_00410]|uniref:Asp23/Gls24 family envelope stress response protein n=1 Tax=Aldersonia sp. NBC_00410 TaxID=2975954 RepID=UPI00224FCC31|nr:Asp23/Gls24 family envelope stress response protein [Aldersonia sp. NBC_00410]MCX5042019.1 Asp23/Gls24 family envelope stress response protein [Aldersonia sp. NBC_00410]
MTEYADPTADIARRVAAAAHSVDGVVALDGGPFGEIATYVPGERVSGVRLSSEFGELHIVTDLRRNLRTVAEEVRAAAESLTGLPFVVTVADVRIDLPDDKGSAQNKGSAQMEER